MAEHWAHWRQRCGERIGRGVDPDDCAGGIRLSDQPIDVRAVLQDLLDAAGAVARTPIPKRDPVPGHFPTTFPEAVIDQVNPSPEAKPISPSAARAEAVVESRRSDALFYEHHETRQTRRARERKISKMRRV